MDQKFFEEQFSALRDHLNARFDGLEKRMDGLEKRMDGLEKRMDATEKIIHKMAIEIEAMRTDLRLVAEGHVMLAEKFSRFEAEYIRHAIEMRQDVLNLYKLTYGQLERRVKELETAR
ncbi:MAG: hypothetical protein AB1478_09885 [Nitrospirota bacterium]